MEKLTATELKNALWDTLHQLKAGNIRPSEADSVSTLSREILRATNTQLRISQQAKRKVSQDLVDFAEE